MLTALVLICSAAVAPDARACTRDLANTVIRMPVQFASPVTCSTHAQAYLAASAIGQELSPGERVTIVCVRKEAAGAAIPSLPTGFGN
jgi:hypothetical protein